MWLSHPRGCVASSTQVPDRKVVNMKIVSKELDLIPVEAYQAITFKVAELIDKANTRFDGETFNLIELDSGYIKFFHVNKLFEPRLFSAIHDYLTSYASHVRNPDASRFL